MGVMRTLTINGLKYTVDDPNAIQIPDTAPEKGTVPTSDGEGGTEWEKPSGSEIPSDGTTGQVLTKTEDGFGWEDLPEQETELPTGGSAGQILTKTANGVAWGDAPSGTFVVTVTGPSSGAYTADKTFFEIQAAADDGMEVVLSAGSGQYLYKLTVAGGSYFEFASTYNNAAHSFMIFTDGYVQYTETALDAELPTGGTSGQVLTIGSDGSPVWEDGKLPVKGVDYYTDEDKAEFEALIVDEMAQRAQIEPEFANDIDECADTTKLYVLPDGYIWAYMPIPEGGIAIPLTWAHGVGLNSSTGAEETKATCSSSQSIEFDQSSTYELTCSNKKSLTVHAYCYESDGTFIERVEIISSTSTDEAETVTLSLSESTASIRLRAYHWTSVDEETSASNCAKISLICIKPSGESSYVWTNTGHAFVPADYEDRIIALEEAIKGDIPIYGIVDENNNIIMTGSLVSGTYTLKYQSNDGTTIEIGTFTME